MPVLDLDQPGLGVTARVQSCKLIDTVLQAVFHNVAKLLRSPKITTSTSERSLLKNLGSWLGMITLARNQPVQMRNLDVKELVCEGYETGRLIAVMPFVSKLLEGAEWHTVESDQTQVVFNEGEPLQHFYVGISGSMELIKGGVPVTVLPPYQVPPFRPPF